MPIIMSLATRSSSVLLRVLCGERIPSPQDLLDLVHPGHYPALEISCHPGGCMVPLSALWLPIVLSPVIVFFASFVMHMLLTYHRSDYHQLPDEEKIAGTLRAANLQRGTYVLPYCLPKD